MSVNPYLYSYTAKESGLVTSQRHDIKAEYNNKDLKLFDKKATYDQLNLVFRRILNQELFNYPRFLVPRYFFRCLCCVRSDKLKKIDKTNYYLRKGVDKLHQDMDVVGIIRMLHNVDIMHSVLFDEFNQFLLKFQRRLVIDSDSNATSENDRQRARKVQREILSTGMSKGYNEDEAQYKRAVFKNLMHGKFKSMLEEDRELDT